MKPFRNEYRVVEMKKALTSPVKLLKSRLYIPSHFQVFFNDLFKFNSHSKVGENIENMQCCLDWLTTAQDVNQDDGVSTGYSFSQGWLPSYPETTGYIIPTMFDYYHLTGDNEYKQRAIKMADWEISVQMESGSVQSGHLGILSKTPAVFNTGQVLFGLVRTYEETQKDKYKKAAEKAANWLVKSQDGDGAWRAGLSTLASNPVHTYNTRTAWGLLQVHSIISKENYLIAAERNIDWALTEQLNNGWFKNNAFNLNEDPLLHTIAYAIRGILECGIYLDNQSYIDAAKKSAEVLLKLQQKDGSLFGEYDFKWKNTVKYSCLTGDAQVSISWLRLFEMTQDKKYLSAAKKMNYYLKTTQNLKSNNKGIHGGIKGSQPIYGGYMGFTYPNWAAKFFVDALLLEDKIEKQIEKRRIKNENRE